MEPGRQRAEAWLADLTRAQREADRNAQQPAQLGAGAEIAGREGRGCQPETIEAQEGSGAARACACACPTAERAMLDEILALPDIEAPTGDGTENVASVVASALESLREDRDAATARADRAEALLAEARAEHRDISQRYIEASSARIRAEALLREGAATLAESLEYIGECARREIAPEIGDGFRDAEALLSEIRGALGDRP